MVSKQMLIDHVVSKNLCTYDKDRNILTDIKTGTEISADAFVKSYRKSTGQSFECIYHEHVSLVSILKCTECGTVIFTHDDEDYEPNLKCPVCTDYRTGFRYYTLKDVEEDENKKKEIEMYIEMDKMQREAEERYIKRGNLYDWQKTHVKTFFNGKNYKADIQFTGWNKWDLQAEINIWKRNGGGFTCKHHIKIPISPKTIWFFIKNKISCKVTWKEV